MEDSGLGSPCDQQSISPEQRGTDEETLVNNDPIEAGLESGTDSALDEAAPEFSAVAGFLSAHLQNRPTAEDLKERNILLPSEEYQEDTKDLLSQDEQDQLKDHLEKVLVGEITIVQEDQQNQNAEGQESNNPCTTHESSSATSQLRLPDRRRDSIRRTLSSKDASALAHRLSKRILKERLLICASLLWAYALLITRTPQS